MLSSAVVVDAAMTARAALYRLEPFAGYDWCVVRRDTPQQVYWYLFPVAEARDVLSWHADEPVTVALDLPERPTSEPVQVGAKEPPARPAVLLDGDSVVGVVRPEPGPPAPPGPPTAFEPPDVAVEPPLKTRWGRLRNVLGGTRGYPARDDVPAPLGEAPEPPMAEPPTDDDDAPETGTFTAVPALTAPATVAPDETFDLVIGWEPPPEAGPPPGTVVIADVAPEFEVGLSVIANGFAAPDGVAHTLRVRRDDPAAHTKTVRLVAHPLPPGGSGVERRPVEVEYAYRGVVVGRAWREVVVSSVGDVGGGAAPPSGVAAVSLGAAPAPDLTVTVSGGERTGTFTWNFVSPHPVVLPAGQVTSDLGDDNARSYAQRVMVSIPRSDRTPLLASQVRGTGTKLRDVAVPPELWDALAAVWQHTATTEQRLPTVLLVTSDPSMPWELVSTEGTAVEPFTDPAAPPLLGAQVALGRWLPPRPYSPRGAARPPSPPSATGAARRMAVVVGDYLAKSGMRALPKATAEGDALTRDYPAVRLSATVEDVAALLDGKTEPVDVVHFAGHGQFDPAHPEYNGIVLNDGYLRLTPEMVEGSTLGRSAKPFVFLNACQLAQPDEVLGYPDGLAAAFVVEGGRGFVAPLWKVDDTVAHDVALEFYAQALDGKQPVGEVLRRLRARFGAAGAEPASTWLAYVFYGHPGLLLQTA